MKLSARRKKLEKIKKRAEAPKVPTMKELTKNFDEFMDGREYPENGKEVFDGIKKGMSKGE